MYKNLSAVALGISGRQSELIELALTYGFRGLELEIDEFFKRAQHQGLTQAARFINSAHIKIGGFELPVRWRGEEAVYRADLERLDPMADCAAKAGAKGCRTLVLPGSDNLPYHENFELHRQRLAEMAAALARRAIRLGVGFLAAPEHRTGRQYPFVHEAESMLTLLKSVSSGNVGLALDTWNWHFGGGTIDHLRGLGVERIVSVYVADAPAGADATSITDEQRLLPSENGCVDCGGMLGLLSQLGFKGPVTLEPHPNHFSGMTREAIVQRSSAVFDELWKAAGLAKTPRFVPAAAPP